MTPPQTLSPPAPPHPLALTNALKEWAAAIRALREGRQVMLLRKGGILDAGGEFSVEAHQVLLFPTYLHEDEQSGSLQTCYGQWLREENRRRPVGETVRFDAWAHITEVMQVTEPNALYRLSSQHIYSDSFLRYRIENEPNKPLYAIFLRTYNLVKPESVALEPDYYGCKSWVTLSASVSVEGAIPALSEYTYSERVRVTRRLLSGG